MCKNKLLYFRYLKKAQTVQTRTYERDPREGQTIAELHFSARTNYTKQILQIKTVSSLSFGKYFSMKNSQQEKQENAYEKIEKAGSERGRHFFCYRSNNSSEP